MIDRFDVGERINDRRSKLGMTQKELAIYTGVTRSTVQKWESGVHLPKKERIPKIAEHLKYSEEYLLYGSDEV
ncbi:XRE family transcriptional regulator [Staphylococcus devriesei]|uniref:helix-turn-helix domain-containing protein n=1 Tax=Staphylococcus devriesei TaxID=586733 RepID=UPI000D1D01CB|nr:helix-turn-helix transcriptional regulator [Staphylococcus devriesei]PTF20457.1 XRE family transcriptional regulator [Staphylococcus devriesei]